MKFALIGCGRIATNHIKAAVENNLEISAICDLLPENMEALLKKHGLENRDDIRRYTDYRQLLEQEDIQLAAIATESGNHAAIALDCIRYKVPIIIEKPIALSIADANKIIYESEKNNVLVSACHQNRFNIAVQELRQAVENNRFGQISHGSVHVRWNRGQDYYTQAPWRGTWAQDGGALMNQCIHGIDLLRWMMGDEIDTVYAATRQRQHPYIEAEDVGMAVLQFKNGAVATVEGTTNVFPKNLEETVYLFGQDGTVKLGGKSCNTLEVWQFADGTSEDDAKQGLEEKVANVYGNGHTSLYADVIESIETNHAPYVDAHAGKRALELVLAIYKSQKTGQPVKLPLDDFSTLDMVRMFD